MAPVPGLMKRVPAPVSRNNQLGGTGPDADKGKGRTQFEDDRRGGNIGKDRPPAYKPDDDGERGGYIGRAKPIPAKPSLSPAGRVLRGSSAVHGMIPRY